MLANLPDGRVIAVNRRLRGTPRSVIGAYHSHPRTEAVPSPRDIAEAHYPEFIWLIVSLADSEGRVGSVSRAVTAWQMNADSVTMGDLLLGGITLALASLGAGLAGTVLLLLFGTLAGLTILFEDVDAFAKYPAQEPW